MLRSEFDFEVSIDAYVEAVSGEYIVVLHKEVLNLLLFVLIQD